MNYCIKDLISGETHNTKNKNIFNELIINKILDYGTKKIYIRLYEITSTFYILEEYKEN